MVSTERITGLVVSCIVIGYLLPVGVGELVNMNTTGWPANVAAMADLFPLFAVLAIMVGILTWIKSR